MGKPRHIVIPAMVSIGVAMLVATAPAMPPAIKLSADSTALVLGGTTLPTPDDAYLDAVKNQFIGPTHPGKTIDYLAVTTPEEAWPVSGILRVGCVAVGPPSLCGPGGPVWPNEPWWKLSGLFDLTWDRSTNAGLADLEQAMAEHGNDHLVIYGSSQGAEIATLEKRRLAQQYPVGTKAPDIDFVLIADVNLPNGGILARFPGLHLPILDLTFNGAGPTATQFDTFVITRQYDGLSDFPLYPANLVADANALLGFFYVHLYGFDVSLAPDASTSPAFQGKHGDTSYYFFETRDLPLFGPLRTLGVPESVIDTIEPFFRVIVELGYDRTIKPWEPAPARLVPTLDPAKVTADLVNAIGEGTNNAMALVGGRRLPGISERGTTAILKPTDAQTAIELAKTDVSLQMIPIEAGQAKMGTENAKADIFPQVATEAVRKTGRATPTRTPAQTNRGRQLRSLPHHGNGERGTNRTAAGGAGVATGARSHAASSSVRSSSTGNSFPRGSAEGSSARGPADRGAGKSTTRSGPRYGGHKEPKMATQ